MLREGMQVRVENKGSNSSGTIQRMEGPMALVRMEDGKTQLVPLVRIHPKGGGDEEDN